MFVGDGGSGSGEEVVPTGMYYEICVVVAVGREEGGITAKCNNNAKCNTNRKCNRF